MRVILLLVTFFLPLSVFASQNHQTSIDSHLHAMESEGYTEILSPVEDRGMKAMVSIKDIDKSMAGEMDHTHHFMVVFFGEDGKPVSEGKVSLNFSKGKESFQKTHLTKMQNQFGTDLVLANREIYKLTVEHFGSNGEVRQFTFTYTTK